MAFHITSLVVDLLVNVETQKRFDIAFPREHIIRTYSYQKQRRNKVQGGKSNQHGTIQNWLKEACILQRRAKDKANISAVLRKTLTAPIVGMLYPTLSALILPRWRKSKQGYHQSSIMLWHRSTKRDIMMILSKHKVDYITITMQVLSLHRVMMLNF